MQDTAMLNINPPYPRDKGLIQVEIMVRSQ